MSRDDKGWGKNTMDLDAWTPEVMAATVITRRKSIAGRLVMAGDIENPLLGRLVNQFLEILKYIGVVKDAVRFDRPAAGIGILRVIV